MNRTMLYSESLIVSCRSLAPGVEDEKSQDQENIEDKGYSRLAEGEVAPNNEDQGGDHVEQGRGNGKLQP